MRSKNVVDSSGACSGLSSAATDLKHNVGRLGAPCQEAEGKYCSFLGGMPAYRNPLEYRPQLNVVGSLLLPGYYCALSQGRQMRTTAVVVAFGDKNHARKQRLMYLTQ